MTTKESFGTFNDNSLPIGVTKSYLDAFKPGSQARSHSLSWSKGQISRKFLSGLRDKALRTKI